MTSPDSPSQETSDPQPEKSELWTTFLQIAGERLPAPLLFVILLIFLLLLRGLTGLDDRIFYLLLLLPVLGLVAWGWWVWQQARERQVERAHELKRLELEKRPSPAAESETVAPAASLATSDDLQHRYLAQLAGRCEFLSLEAIDVTATRPDAARLALHSVFTVLDVRASPEKPDAPEEMARRTSRTVAGLRPGHPDDAEQREPALAALSRAEKVVLLGKPGSGKSTLVDYIALCLAGDVLQRPGDPTLDSLLEAGWQTRRWLLPVRVVLRDYAARGLPAGKSLWAFIGGELARADEGQADLAAYAPYLEKHLRRQGSLLLLDGLDEVPDAHQWRERLRREVLDFAGEFPKARIIVTGRPYAYARPEWQLPGFARADLLDFSLEQMAAYIDRRYAVSDVGMDRERAGQFADELKEQIERRSHLRELAARPLLLALITSLHRNRGGGSLPQDRERLYDMSVDMLLDLWQRRKQIPLPDDAQELTQLLGVGLEDLRAALSRVAFEVHRDQPSLEGTADIRAGQLAEALHGKLDRQSRVTHYQIIDYISDRAGLLEEREAPERGREIYAFAHRTFQEYLAGCHLLTRDDFADEAARLARPDPKRWREALLLAARRDKNPAPAWDLVDALCAKGEPGATVDEGAWWGAFLAGQVLLERELWQNPAERRRELLDRVRAWLLALVTRGALTPSDRAAAGDALAQLGDPRAEVTSVDGMLLCLVPAGPFWLGSEEEVNERPLRLYERLDRDYYLGLYPVTVAQFRQFVDESNYSRVFEGSLHGPANRPVSYLTWFDARAFCDWLDGRWRANGWLPDGYRVRLPSEVEWEKAARGGLDVPVEPQAIAAPDLRQPGLPDLRSNELAQRRFPWGDEADAQQGNYEETGIGNTSAVGCFPGNCSLYGCREMSGNVFEWTRSRWGKDISKPDFGYPYDADDGREATEKVENLDLMMLRGGSYVAGISLGRCASRVWSYAGSGVRDFGMCVAVSPF